MNNRSLRTSVARRNQFNLPLNTHLPTTVGVVALEPKRYGGASVGLGQMAQPDAELAEEYEYAKIFIIAGGQKLMLYLQL